MTEILILVLITVVTWGIYLLAGYSKKAMTKEVASVIYLFGFLTLFEYYNGSLLYYIVFLAICAVLLAVRLLTRIGKKIHWAVSELAFWGLALGSYDCVTKFSGLSSFWSLVIVALVMILGSIIVFFIFKHRVENMK